ncbi:hypothetical protein Bpfe_003470, partial [Biomphalaria pfeifferi]
MSTQNSSYQTPNLLGQCGTDFSKSKTSAEIILYTPKPAFDQGRYYGGKASRITDEI